MDDNRIKQRIIGAIVLVSLGVIFMPMILSGRGEQSLPLFGSPIPPKPDNIADIKILEFENTPRPPDPQTEIRTPIDKYSQKDDLPVVAPVKPALKETVQKKVDETKAIIKQEKPLKAWVVQVGSFSNRKNALALKEKLVKNGFRAFVERIIQHDKTSYRVRVGPEVRRENATKLQKQIEQKLNIKGLVMTHP